ncbi:MAG: hypothetical protein M1817_005287 [Caeruleum heppii]|nr:MAG: hypothetical protein M1817_005287 [Caeruleum heppii]
MSLRIVPTHSHPTATALSATSAPSAPGLHDTLRSTLLPIQPASSPSPSQTTTSHCQPTSSHPLEARLQKWQATQEALKMEGLRRMFGMAEPVRRGMELRIAEEGEWRPDVLGGSAGVSADVLRGREAEMGWEDVFRGDGTRETLDFHTQMERRLRMNW